MKKQTAIISLSHWFKLAKRSLPWRENPTPYAVWVSEVMLQQTQVAVVVPYYERWMRRFPTVEALAAASLDEVIKLWEGLGYYSRARYLHAGAQYVLKAHQGKIPSDEQELSKIKGLGPYTIGAIRSFAFHQKAAAIDGNVVRVITRLCGIHDDVSKSKTQQEIRSCVEELLPAKESWIISEALIELGATVCTRAPKCPACPVSGYCRAFAEESALRLPYNSKKTQYEFLYRGVAVISSGSHLLLRRGERGRLMADLYEFPYFDCSAEGMDAQRCLEDVGKAFGLSAKVVRALDEVSHSFTRYQAKLFPWLLITNERKPIEGLQWVPEKSVHDFAFSSGHLRILNQLTDCR